MAAEEKKTWTDQGELSFVNTGGNTEVTTLSLKNTLEWNFSPNNTAILKGGALYGESDGEKNAENYFAELRLNHDFTKKSYIFAMGGWRQDKFAGYDRRLYGGGGTGYKFLDGPTHMLEGEIGANYMNEEYIDNTSSDFIQGRAFAEYQYHFTKKSFFSQSGEFLYDFSDSDAYRVNSVTALTSALNDYFSLKASYTIKYNNKPVPDTLKDTDTTLSIALVLNI